MHRLMKSIIIVISIILVSLFLLTSNKIKPANQEVQSAKLGLALRSRHYESPYIVVINGEPITRMTVGDVFKLTGYPLLQNNEALIRFVRPENLEKWGSAISFVNMNSSDNLVLEARMISKEPEENAAIFTFTLPKSFAADDANEFAPLPSDIPSFEMQCLKWFSAIGDALRLNNYDEAAKAIGYKDVGNAFPDWIVHSRHLNFELRITPESSINIVRGKKFALINSSDGSPLVTIRDKVAGVTLEIGCFLIAKRHGLWSTHDGLVGWREIEFQ